MSSTEVGWLLKSCLSVWLPSGFIYAYNIYTMRRSVVTTNTIPSDEAMLIAALGLILATVVKIANG